MSKEIIRDQQLALINEQAQLVNVAMPMRMEKLAVLKVRKLFKLLMADELFAKKIFSGRLVSVICLGILTLVTVS
jgi:hypothetical protein